ncbi:MAG: type II toxin-antitoxin system VapC family toxin [Cytophagales bacterium]
MAKRYVIDTNSLISYFSDIFGEPSKISKSSLSIINSAFLQENVVLIIPNVVFVEIFKKWYRSNEWSEKIKYEVYQKVISRPNIEIRSIDIELIEYFVSITEIESKYNFDNHDKQILACAMMLDCDLITSDQKLMRYNRRMNVVPAIHN